MYKAVIFDLDDTLYDYQSLHPVAVERLRAFTCARLGIPADAFDEAFAWAKARTKERAGSTGAGHNRLLYCQKTLERLGRNPVDGALEMYGCYWDALLADMTLRDGTVPLLRRLKADGVKIAICTDLTAHIQHRKIRALGLVPYIDALVTSEEAGAEKPDEKMYELTQEKLGLPAHDCLFVGDDAEKDVAAPRRFGMDAVPFTSMQDVEAYIYGR